jgi:hypothetical protein
MVSNVSEKHIAYISLSLTKEAAGFSETLVTTYETTLRVRRNPEE